MDDGEEAVSWVQLSHHRLK